jgi:hypothetical protein
MGYAFTPDGVEAFMKENRLNAAEPDGLARSLCPSV